MRDMHGFFLPNSKAVMMGAVACASGASDGSLYASIPINEPRMGAAVSGENTGIFTSKERPFMAVKVRDRKRLTFQ